MRKCRNATKRLFARYPAEPPMALCALLHQATGVLMRLSLTRHIPRRVWPGLQDAVAGRRLSADITTDKQDSWLIRRF